jgi:hypothetical protein
MFVLSTFHKWNILLVLLTINPFAYDFEDIFKFFSPVFHYSNKKSSRTLRTLRTSLECDPKLKSTYELSRDIEH